MTVLALEVELLTGAYRAALPDGSGPEWPPHPERLFSALAQSWADGDLRTDERRALEWLEQQEPPMIEAAPIALPRATHTVYVPPNDFEIPSSTKPFVWPRDRTGRPKPARKVSWAGIEPGIRAWTFGQARRFELNIPENDLFAMIWGVGPPDEMAAPLDRLARRVSSIGHSSSLVRCRWSQRSAPPPERTWQLSDSGRISVRVPYKGRLADLERWWAQAMRPRSRAWARYTPPASSPSPSPPAASAFGHVNDWFVFEGVDPCGPDALALAHVTRRVRDALMAVGPQPPPPLLSGHGALGGRACEPHVAVLPLIDVGWASSGGVLMGFAVVLPRAADPDARCAVMAALARFAPPQPDGGVPIAELRISRQLAWNLQRSPAPRRAALRPARWCASHSSWASVTPVVLDRYPRRRDPREEARLIARACRNIGLPEPDHIAIHKHSAVRGAPSAYLSKKGGPGWTFPIDSKLPNRPRRHVVLRFAASVTGPIVLGAGRYHGFGLCLPIDVTH